MATHLRALFDIPDDIAYINCAYLSPLLNSVVEAGRRSILRKAHPWTILHRDFFAEVEETRAAFAALIGAQPGDIAITGSTAYGVANAVANIPFGPGDNIVVPAAEHASAYHKWRTEAALRGAELRIRTLGADGDWAAAITGGIDARTRAVAVPHVHWSDGRLFDLDRIGAAARQVGARLVVDGTQSVGALPLDVGQVRPDYLVCSAYKWLMCPYGFAFLYVAPEHQAGLPFEEHYFHRTGAAEHEGRLEQIEEYDAGARRFDMGERSNFITLPMAIVALRQLLDWSVPEVHRRIGIVADAIIDGTARLGYTAAPPHQRSPHLFGLRHPAGLPKDLGARLRAANVFVSIRGDAIRVSPHVYNTEADVARFVAALAGAR